MLRIPERWEGVACVQMLHSLHSSYVSQPEEQVNTFFSSHSCQLWACTQAKCWGMCGHLEVSPLCRLEWGSAAPSPPPVSGPGCINMNIRAFIFQLSAVPLLVVACPRVAYLILCRKEHFKLWLNVVFYFVEMPSWRVPEFVCVAFYVI